jgi:hypothetical protein
VLHDRSFFILPAPTRMSHHDVFNGDADGICALHQLRLAAPRESSLVTGVKRDIALVDRVRAHPGDTVTVLDVSLDRNRDAVVRLLEQHVAVEYFDHHFAGAIPQHPLLAAHIDTASEVCTSVLVDRHLAGRHRLWAVVAAFGDNLEATARELAHRCGLQPAQTAMLRELGRSINYNGYGDCEADLLMPPASLYRAVRPFASPFDFLGGHEAPRRLSEARSRDMEQARRTGCVDAGPAGALAILPDTSWARRVQGEFANELAASQPQRAHAVLCELAAGYRVSVRAPLARPHGAQALCQRFPTGGGRSAAGGIDLLPRERLDDFTRAFAEAFDPRGSPQA